MYVFKKNMCLNIKKYILWCNVIVWKKSDWKGMRKCYLLRKALFSNQVLKIHSVKCIFFLSFKIAIPFPKLWMENEDYKEPFFSYGNAEAVVDFVEVLNYSKKLNRDCQGWW